MSISEDTVALVAAQLTSAWATREKERPGKSRLTAADEVLGVYRGFAKAIRDPDGQPSGHVYTGI